MSVVSDRHTFVPFTSGESKPFADQRLAKVGYKAKSGKTSVCVSIPKLTDTSVDAINAAFPVDMRKRAEDFQDSLIRNLYESGNTAIGSHEIDQRAILAYLEAENNAGRLSAEKVREWFNGEFLETALPVLAEKYQTEDDKVLQQKCNAWLAAFVSLTGNSPISIDRLRQLRSLTNLVGEDDIVGNRVHNKILTLIAELEALEDL
jgi:hypothetical protein